MNKFLATCLTFFWVGVTATVGAQPYPSKPVKLMVGFPAGGGLDVLRTAGVETEHADSAAARAQNEAWRVWVAAGRPFVILKLALTLDGRVAASPKSTSLRRRPWGCRSMRSRVTATTVPAAPFSNTLSSNTLSSEYM